MEGVKIVNELLHSNQFHIHSLYYTKAFEYKSLKPNIQAYEIDEKSLAQISTLQTPNQVVAVVHVKKDIPFVWDQNKKYIALDGIQDPGNLGTIIRTAEWFGIDTILCSKQCVEYTNPKVIMSSMGSFLRMQLYYVDFIEIFKNNPAIPLIGAFLEGENLYQTTLDDAGILVIGSESHGISKELASYIQTKVKIPSFGEAESLNASIAHAVILSEWKRQEHGRK
ncbi:MAG: RNA methyltransferase [Bacteroidota bacterium]